jgi:hypothetical protein
MFFPIPFTLTVVSTCRGIVGHFEDDARNKTPAGTKDKMELGILVNEHEKLQK